MVFKSIHSFHAHEIFLSSIYNISEKKFIQFDTLRRRDRYPNNNGNKDLQLFTNISE